MNQRPILIVEDNADIRDTLREVLELDGHAVRTAENGEAGLRLIMEIGPPCLVLLDLMMPVMDGWQFYERLRHESDAAVAATPVIVLSGIADATRVGGGIDCPVLRKPVDIDELIGLVRACCV